MIAMVLMLFMCHYHAVMTTDKCIDCDVRFHTSSSSVMSCSMGISNERLRSVGSAGSLVPLLLTLLDGATAGDATLKGVNTMIEITEYNCQARRMVKLWTCIDLSDDYGCMASRLR